MYELICNTQSHKKYVNLMRQLTYLGKCSPLCCFRSINQKNRFASIATAAVKINREQQSNRDQQEWYKNYRNTLSTVIFGAVIFAKTTQGNSIIGFYCLYHDVI